MNETKELRFRFVAHSVRGWTVYCNEAKIGQIWKTERRYNLRRQVVIRGWSARTAEGDILSTRREPTTYRTRVMAAEALLERTSCQGAAQGEEE